jgi:hypothetical protein
MFGGLFSFAGEVHEVTQNNDSNAKTENSIFNLILVFIFSLSSNFNSVFSHEATTIVDM